MEACHVRILLWYAVIKDARMGSLVGQATLRRLTHHKYVH